MTRNQSFHESRGNALLRRAGEDCVAQRRYAVGSRAPVRNGAPGGNHSVDVPEFGWKATISKPILPPGIKLTTWSQEIRSQP